STPGAEVRVLTRHRFFHFDEQFARFPHLVGGIQRCGSGGDVGGIGMARTLARASFENHVVTAGAQGKRAFGSQPNASLAILPFSNRADAHRLPPRRWRHGTTYTDLPLNQGDLRTGLGYFRALLTPTLKTTWFRVAAP